MLSNIPWYQRPLVPEAVFLTYYSLILWWRVFPHGPGVAYRFVTAQTLRQWMWRGILILNSVRPDLEPEEE
ncbi:Ff.00g096350.m01.CDS01 [Fusarium sp. VM40]|nr:Ff.00g096350.m01.CDS01 [Fusarium sp. VM40]